MVMAGIFQLFSAYTLGYTSLLKIFVTYAFAVYTIRKQTEFPFRIYPKYSQLVRGLNSLIPPQQKDYTSWQKSVRKTLNELLLCSSFVSR